MPKVRKLFYLEDPSSAPLTSEMYEDKILYRVGNYSTSEYKPLDEYKILMEHFKKGGSIRNVSYFYENIFKFANYRHGDGYRLVYTFCRNSLKGRLPLEVESKLFSGDGQSIWEKYRGAAFAYKYAKYVIRGRLPVAYEAKCGNYDYLMFLYKLKEDFSSMMILNSGLAYNFYKYNSWLPDEVHNAMIARSMMKDYHARSYFKMRKKDDKLIKNRLKVFDSSKTIAEIMASLG